MAIFRALYPSQLLLTSKNEIQISNKKVGEFKWKKKDVLDLAKKAWEFAAPKNHNALNRLKPLISMLSSFKG